MTVETSLKRQVGWWLLAVGVTAAGLALAQPPAGRKEQRKAPAAKAEPAVRTTETPEAAVRHSAQAFVAAYNAHDAAAVAQGFAADAEFVGEDGLPIRGREAIQRHFAATFARFPDARISIEIESIQSIAPNAVVEEGRVEFRPEADRLPLTNRYSAVHVQQQGRWLLSRVRDFPVSGDRPTARDALPALDWLVGDWVEETEAAYVRLSCRWVDGRNYLLQEFKIRMTDQPTVTGSTRIGWDPLAQEVRSWTFDSSGGFSNARWTPAPGGWLVKSQGVTHSGRLAAATTLLKKIDGQTFAWESRDRLEPRWLPTSTDAVVFKRRAPPAAN
ncbi:MAG: SgcJ/EcaC family oxidoreductase [Planctomycetaceae bacterium]